MLVTMLVNVYGITLGIDAGKELGSLDRSFDGYNGRNFVLQTAQVRPS